MVIELDGDFHFDEQVMKDDEKRTEQIEEEGIKVIRFENQEVLLNLDSSSIKNKKLFQEEINIQFNPSSLRRGVRRTGWCYNLDFRIALSQNHS